MAALQTNELERGIRLLDKAIRISPDVAPAYSNRGVALRDLGRLAEAIASYDKAIALAPDFAEAYNNRGVALSDLRRFDEAIASYDKAIALKPDYIQAHNNRGIALRGLRRFDEALASYDRAIALNKDYAEAHNNRGVALRDLKRFAEALACHERAIALRPEYAEAHSNRGLALKDLNRFDEAIASYDRAIALAPRYGEAHNNRGLALRDLNRFDEAIASYDRAIALKPGYADAYFNKSFCYLTMGRLAEGWKFFEYRKRKPDPIGFRPYARPIWLGGESLAGKTVFLYSEQGLGDTIQFCRYARLVKAEGARVVLSVQDKLVRLLRPLEPAIAIMGEAQAPDAFDFHCPLMSLPLAFGTTPETIPSEPRYLLADPALKAEWAARLPPKTRPRIGLAWSGNAAHLNDHNRSLDPGLLAPLLPFDADWFCLQPELRDIGPRDWSGITFLGEALTDFADTAAVIDQLDLVITVDTSVAHLAGALGKQVWILLPFSSDWRWLLDREDSPWYPSARLFRQRRIDDWPSVIAQVRSELVSRFR
jgi:tetratricopeptide (TPR) repeat protein